MSEPDDGDSGESISSRQSLVLDLPPSCIEFCPAHPSYFLVGTYHLQKEERPRDEAEDHDDDDGRSTSPETTARQPQTRNGSIVVFQLRNGTAHAIQTLPQPSAVFDLHFQPEDRQGRASDICATVSSTGTISLLKLTPPPPAAENTESLIPLGVLRIPTLDENALFTFFAWHPTIAGLMAITTAAGAVVLVRIHQDCQGLDVLEDSIMEHDGLEAWCAAFSQPQSPLAHGGPSPPVTIFSGGDDSKLRYTLYYNDSDDGQQDTAANSQVPYPPVSLGQHQAGVTFILPLPLPPNANDGSFLVATGSYDESLRIWSITPLDKTGGLRRATCLAEKNLGGGVWRLKLLDGKKQQNDAPWDILILASCMHAGSRIVRVRGDEKGEVDCEVLARFEEHKSMNYGSDWFRGREEGGGWLCVSTSFYDRLLCVWTFRDAVGNGTAS